MKNKNKKNNKGFTLIELLAVVVILLSISVMAISSISAAIERNKTKQNNAKIQIIESYAKLFYDEHKNSVKSGDCIGIDELGLDKAEKEDADGKEFKGCVKVTINGGNVTAEFVPSSE